MFVRVIEHYPEAAAAVGRMLARYPEVEFDMYMCVRAVMDDDEGTFKALFRTRGETQRVEIADGLARLRFHSLGLGTPFEMVIGDMRHFLKIRNQYAHAHWDVNPEQLAFMDMEENAKQHGTLRQTIIDLRHTTRELIEEQERYGGYVTDQFWWLGREANVKRGKLKRHGLLKPKQLKPPPFYSRRGKQESQTPEKAK